MNNTRQRYVEANRKSGWTAGLLALFLGPVGALYGSPIGGLILILVTVAGGGLTLVATWPLSLWVALAGVERANEKVEAEADLLSSGR